jgi:hypothetical protein
VIVARPAVEVVVAGAAVDRVVAGAAVGTVVPVGAREPVVARAAVERVVPGGAEEVIVIGAAAQRVVAVAALEDVVLAPAVEHVVAAEACDEVAQAGAGDGIGPTGALHAGEAGLDDDAQRRGARQRHRAQPPMGERAHQRQRRAAAVGVVDAHPVGRPAGRAGTAPRAKAAHVAPGDVYECGGGAAARRAYGQGQPVGRGGHRPAHALAEAQRALLGPARALAHQVQASWRADPRARRGVEGGAGRALDLDPAQQLRRARRHHRQAALGQHDRRQRPLVRQCQRARRAVQAHPVADGERLCIEHEQALAGGRVHARAAGRDGDPHGGGAEVAREHRERGG